jgi:hypothetical protein
LPTQHDETAVAYVQYRQNATLYVSQHCCAAALDALGGSQGSVERLRKRHAGVKSGLAPSHERARIQAGIHTLLRPAADAICNGKSGSFVTNRKGVFAERRA